MLRTCRAPGCTSPADSRFAIYCSAHKARQRRHGAVDQAGVTEAALAPYRSRVRARVKRNEGSPLWAQLEARWRTVVDHAQGIREAAERGHVGIAHERKAADEAVKIGTEAEASRVVETALAMFLLLEDQPRRFRSDASFRVQLVRRVRALTDVNAGTYWDDKAGKVRRVYRDLSPRAGLVLGLWLADAFGGAGLHLAKLEERDRDAKERQQQELHAALEGLQ
jgi:hypothetical protein